MAYCKKHDEQYALYCSGCRKERKEERERDRPPAWQFTGGDGDPIGDEPAYGDYGKKRR